MIVTLRQVLYLIYMRHSLQRGVCVGLVAAVLRGIRTIFILKKCVSICAVRAVGLRSLRAAMMFAWTHAGLSPWSHF